jgi:hypothetical protein
MDLTVGLKNEPKLEDRILKLGDPTNIRVLGNYPESLKTWPTSLKIRQIHHTGGLFALVLSSCVEQLPRTCLLIVRKYFSWTETPNIWQESDATLATPQFVPYLNRSTPYCKLLESKISTLTNRFARFWSYFGLRLHLYTRLLRPILGQRPGSAKTVINVQDWNPHMNFILKGSQIPGFQMKGWFKIQIQDVNPRIHNWNTKLMLNLRMNYMVHISNSIMWRIKNQPSNSTSCIDNTLRLLVLVVGILNRGLQVISSSFSIWDCILKSCFERDVYFEGLNHVWKALKTSILSTDHNMQHGVCAESHAILLLGSTRLCLCVTSLTFEPWPHIIDCKWSQDFGGSMATKTETLLTACDDAYL